jgi:hypothetical protein
LQRFLLDVLAYVGVFDVSVNAYQVNSFSVNCQFCAANYPKHGVVFKVQVVEFFFGLGVVLPLFPCFYSWPFLVFLFLFVPGESERYDCDSFLVPCCGRFE